MGLMTASGGLTNRKLALATATPDKVSADATYYAGDKNVKTGTLIERGTDQYAGGIGGGGSGSSAYVALNKIPEGIYRANGTERGPEIRVNLAEMMDYIINVVNNKSETIANIDIDNTTTTRTVSVSVGQTWLFVLLSAYGIGGSAPTLSTPSAQSLLNVSTNITRNTNYQNRQLLVRILRFTASGTVTATIKVGNEWAGAYFGFFKIAP